MKKEFVADFDFEFDEKHKTVSVTEQGVEKAERFLGIDHLYRAENGPLVNHLQQALKAESLYKRDEDYAVIDGEVKIIDEFTGRILEGRRWSEGLHQAVEAKEGVRVQEENQTLAQITLQNYFRMYDKLAGMTGTALTEATEFMKIYKLPVVQVPTNRPMVRAGPERSGLQDQGRQVARRRRGDRRAATRRASRSSSARSPSRSPSCCPRSSTRRGVKHTVLNAKPEHAEREGEIVAEAGPARRGHDRDEHGRPRRRHQARRQRRAPHRARAGQARPQARRPGLRRALRRDPARRSSAASRRTARRSWRPAACSSSAPSATSRAASTTSCAAAPAARATPASRASSSPPRTTSCACSPATGSTRSSTASGTVDERGQRGADRGRDALQADREGAEEGRGAELPHPQARPRVRRRHERAAADRLRVPRPGARGQGHGRGRPRGARAGHRAASSTSTRPATSSRSGTSTASPSRSTTCGTTEVDIATLNPDQVDREELIRAPARGRRQLYDAARGRARRGAHARARALPAAADHRPALARAPLRHGLPARGHPPARVRPDRADRRLQERGVRALHRPDEHDLAGLRADDLQRRGRGRGRERRRRRRRRPQWGGGGSSTGGASRVSYSGGAGTAQPSALAMAAGGAAVRADGTSRTATAPRPPPVVEQRRVSEEEQIGRNDPCWCGSGKKFKKCHGA